MTTSDIISAIDSEIARLQSARNVLSGVKRRGRPPASVVNIASAPGHKSAGRKMSAATRKKMSEAMKRRWATKSVKSKAS